MNSAAPYSVAWFSTIWLLATLIIMVLPLLPAFRELSARSDAGALPIDHLDDGRTDYEAHLTSERLPLLDASGNAADWARDTSGTLMLPPTLGGLRMRTAQPLIISMGSTARTIYSENTVELHSRSRVTEILHARGIRSLGPCELAPLSSASRHVMLSPGSRFQRLSAISTFTWPLRRDLRPRIDPAHLKALKPTAPARRDGHMRVPDRTTVIGDLIVNGDLQLGEHSIIIGHVKVHGNTTFAPHAQVIGALFCLKDIVTMGSNFIGGPLCANRRLRLGAHSQVGHRHTPSSASAYIVELDSSVHIYGNLSAFHLGMVVS